MSPGPTSGKRGSVPPKASERTIRDWREVGAAFAQKVFDQTTPIGEGYASLPEPAIDALFATINALDEFDRHLAKIDGQRGGVGGVYELVWGGSGD